MTRDKQSWDEFVDGGTMLGLGAGAGAAVGAVAAGLPGVVIGAVFGAGAGLLVTVIAQTRQQRRPPRPRHP